MQAPKAKKIPHPHHLHGEVREDDYYWLHERDDPEVIRYLQEENRYYQEAMQSLQPLTDRLLAGMMARIPDTEVHVPAQDGDYFYYERMDKQLPYPVYARKRASHRHELDDRAEEILLDLNTLAVDGGYLSVSVLRVSPDGMRLAYLENRDGTDEYKAYVRDVLTGDKLPDELTNVFIDESLEWDATGEHLFYITTDGTQRPHQLWRHRMGTTGADELLYEETDTTFSLRLKKSRSGRFLFVKSESTNTDEVRYLAADEPRQALRLFDARRAGIRYDVEHWGDDFLILTNENAPNFRLMRCPVENPKTRERADLVPYDDTRYLQAVVPFRDALVIGGRQDGLTQLWVCQHGALTRLEWDEPLFSVSAEGNRSYDTTEVLVEYQSFLTPRSTYSVNLLTGERILLQEAPVAGDYDRASYRQEHIWATADDGRQVPMMLVYRAGAFGDGPAPTILTGYGAYGFSSDPDFDASRLPLLDLGVVYAVAQIRGGSEMGRSWYEEGKMLHKRNTFTDFITAARTLIHRGMTTSAQLAAFGLSAGGLLMGAVANMAGDLFQAIVPGVPFVDVITTMLDTTIPLTTLEWEEWGNPQKAEEYAYIRSYSPYDNIETKGYPHMLVTAGLNDPRVGYWEPAKWVARLRDLKADSNVLLLKTNMGAGHFGASGRVDLLREWAEMYAFMLDKIGVRIE